MVVAAAQAPPYFLAYLIKMRFPPPEVVIRPLPVRQQAWLRRSRRQAEQLVSLQLDYPPGQMKARRCRSLR
ncbi:hypothetical protein GCM10009077_12760 [Roseibium denhamense]